IKFIALGLIILVAVTGCAPSNTGTNIYGTRRNVTNKPNTRLGNTGYNAINNGMDTTDLGWNNGWNTTNTRLNTSLNNNRFDARNMDDLGNATNTPLNNGMTRPNNNLGTTGMGNTNNLGNTTNLK